MKPSFGEWIRVDDELPEDSGEYLVYDMLTSSILLYEYEENSGFCEYISDGRILQNEEVTHWMPLPDPFTEDYDGYLLHKDGLPEEENYYLAWIDGNIRMVSFEKPEGFQYDDCYGHIYSVNPDYWMELPEIPDESYWEF